MLPWLVEPLERLLAVHADGRLPHALVIRAGEGWGETVLANDLAMALIGRRDVENARELAHPDFKWIQPEGSVIKVDQIRALAEFAIGTRQSAPSKAAVIENAELMNDNAANALLKTLEEPPPDTYLILTTCRPARLLPTIVSRCQIVTLARDPGAALDWLADRWSASEIEQKLFECGAAPLTVDRALAEGEPLLAPQLAALAGSGATSAQVAGLLEWEADRLTGAWYRHCVALLAGEGRVDGVCPVGDEALSAFVDDLQSVRYQLLMTNSANPRLLLERLVARWRAAVRVT